MMKKKRRAESVCEVIGLRYVLHAALLRRRRRFYGHLFPFLSALSGCLLLLLAALSLLSPPPQHRHFIPYHSRRHGGEVAVQRDLTAFRAPEIGGGSGSGSDLWSSVMSSFYHGCSNSSQDFVPADRKTEPDRYLLIATSGGLNQQRTGITDAVVVAYILNATLVVPKLDQKSFWKDTSDFAEIFDVDWFTSFLSKDVKIIKELPTMDGKALNPYTTRVPRKCTPSCYRSRILPMLVKRHAVLLTKFDYRLSNRLDTDLQKLRCRANYHALKFTDPIHDMGKKLIERMRMKSKHFIALHLRYEPDMLAFSQCYYGGGDKERKELGKIRKRWKTLHASNPDKVRRHGRCPLTPEEVGLMLRALGFESDTHIYVASGEVYGGEETLAPLKALFPNFHSKETIASKEELAPFSSFSSRMAAVDFIVCDESDVFVTNNNGNMAKMLAGRRRYFGHKPTIRPNAKKLSKLFMNRNNMTWEEFASRVRTQQIGFMGEPNELKPGTGVFHENPASCICEDPEAKTRRAPDPKHVTAQSLDQITQNHNDTRNNASDFNEYEQLIEDDQDWGDTDYGENGIGFQGKGPSNVTGLDYRVVPAPALRAIEEIFSD